MVDRVELGAFLRARREQVRPEDVGLRVGRRRTPGLRREEVATLAGISVDYLIRLEQGRDQKPSGSVVNALAGALRMDDDERLHLAKLAAVNSTREMCPEAVALQTDVAPNVRTIIARLEPSPAFVLGPAGHLLAWNESWRALVQPLGVLDRDPPNLAHYVFADTRAREVLADWSRAADEQVGRLRAAWLRWGDDPSFVALVDELRAVPEFESRWSSHKVLEQRSGPAALRHPVVGELRLEAEVLLLPDHAEQQLVTWLPADEAAEAALRTAIGLDDARRSRRLRVVGER